MMANMQREEGQRDQAELDRGRAALVAAETRDSPQRMATRPAKAIGLAKIDAMNKRSRRRGRRKRSSRLESIPSR